jgi:hypothetical protein
MCRRWPINVTLGISPVICDGFRALRVLDRAEDYWLLTSAAPAYEALKADPSRGLGLEDLRIALAKRHASKADRRPKA